MREGSLQKSNLIELYPTERPKSSSNSVKNLSLGEINRGKCAQVDATVSVCVSKFSFASSWHDIFRIYFWPRKNGKENSITNINTQLSEKRDDMSVAGSLPPPSTAIFLMGFISAFDDVLAFHHKSIRSECSHKKPKLGWDETEW